MREHQSVTTLSPPPPPPPIPTSFFCQLQSTLMAVPLLPKREHRRDEAPLSVFLSLSLSRQYGSSRIEKGRSTPSFSFRGRTLFPLIFCRQLSGCIPITNSSHRIASHRISNHNTFVPFVTLPMNQANVFGKVSATHRSGFDLLGKTVVSPEGEKQHPPALPKARRSTAPSIVSLSSLLDFPDAGGAGGAVGAVVDSSSEDDDEYECGNSAPSPHPLWVVCVNSRGYW